MALAGALAQERLLIVGAYRNDEIGRGHALRRLRNDLRRAKLLRGSRSSRSTRWRPTRLRRVSSASRLALRSPLRSPSGPRACRCLSRSWPERWPCVAACARATPASSWPRHALAYPQHAARCCCCVSMGWPTRRCGCWSWPRWSGASSTYPGGGAGGRDASLRRCSNVDCWSTLSPAGRRSATPLPARRSTTISPGCAAARSIARLPRA